MKIVVRDVARKLSLSPATVSRVINGDYGKGASSVATATKVLDYCLAKGFISKQKRDSILYKMESHVSQKRVFCLSCFEGLWGHNAIFSSVSSALQDRGEYTSLFTIRDESDLCRFPFDLTSVAIFFGRMKPETQENFLESNIPVVLIDNYVPDLTWSSVNSDNLDAMSRAVDILAGKGHKRIAFVCRHEDKPQKTYNLHRRQSGYIVGMCNNGLDYGDLIITATSSINSYSPNGNDEAMNDLIGLAEKVLDLNPRPTAVIAANDLTAHVIRAQAIKRGLSIPDDLSIIGHDGQHRIPGIVGFEPISSMVVDWQNIGKAAVDMSMELMLSNGEAQKHIVIASTFDDVGTVGVPR